MRLMMDPYEELENEETEIVDSDTEETTEDVPTEEQDTEGEANESKTDEDDTTDFGYDPTHFGRKPTESDERSADDNADGGDSEQSTESDGDDSASEEPSDQDKLTFFDFASTPEFKDDKEALDYYKNLATNSEQYLQSDEFAEKLSNNYKEQLLAAEQEVQEMKSVYQAMKQDPDKFLRENFSPQLQKLGYNTKYTDEKISEMVNEQMKAEYGEDWEKTFDPNLLKDPTTLSSKMYAKQQEIYHKLNQENTVVSNSNQETIDPESVKEFYDKAYEQEGLKDVLSPDEYKQFVNEAESKQWSVTDFYRAYNFDKLQTQRYNDGVEEGRKQLIEEIRKQGGKLAASDIDKEEETTVSRTKYDDPLDFYMTR